MFNTVNITHCRVIPCAETRSSAESVVVSEYGGSVLVVQN